MQWQDCGWSRLLSLAFGFVPPGASPEQVEFGLAVYNHIPVDLPMSSVEVEFVHSGGSQHKEAAVFEAQAPISRYTENFRGMFKLEKLLL